MALGRSLLGYLDELLHASALNVADINCAVAAEDEVVRHHELAVVVAPATDAFGNAAIGVSWQLFIVVIVFIASVFSGMGVLVARFAGAEQPEKVARVVFQVFGLTILLGLLVFATTAQGDGVGLVSTAKSLPPATIAVIDEADSLGPIEAPWGRL